MLLETLLDSPSWIRCNRKNFTLKYKARMILRVSSGANDSRCGLQSKLILIPDVLSFVTSLLLGMALIPVVPSVSQRSGVYFNRYNLRIRQRRQNVTRVHTDSMFFHPRTKIKVEAPSKPRLKCCLRSIPTKNVLQFEPVDDIRCV